MDSSLAESTFGQQQSAVSGPRRHIPRTSSPEASSPVTSQTVSYNTLDGVLGLAPLPRPKPPYHRQVGVLHLHHALPFLGLVRERESTR